MEKHLTSRIVEWETLLWLCGFQSPICGGLTLGPWNAAAIHIVLLIDLYWLDCRSTLTILQQVVSDCHTVSVTRPDLADA